MIPVNTPLFIGNEKKYLAECIDSGWVSSEGPFVQKLEEGLARRVGRRHAIAVANGSAALEVAVAALRLRPGDEVVMPALTIISCAAPIVRAGAVPVLVDADERTFNMKVEEVEAKITPRTRAVMAVHLYGLPVDMIPLMKLAEKHGLALIEDAAEAIGQTYFGKPCGSFGDLSTFSFYPNKHITTGEGGMVLTDDDALAARCRSLRNLCFLPERRFLHEELGWNHRLSNLQAAVGVAQMERLDEFVSRKRKMGKRYDSLLSGIAGLQLPLTATAFAENIYWVYTLVLGGEIPLDARQAMARLGDLGIGTRPFFCPMHLQPVFRRMGLFEKDRHPVAERLWERGFYLPSGLGLTEGEMEEVAGKVRLVLGR